MFRARIEPVRLLAVLMLVTYHVVGDTAESGLEIADTHPLRLVMSLLADLRMPLFACISGFLYALKPVSPAAYPTFIRGKFRRLAVPATICIAGFLGASQVMGTKFMPQGPIWHAFVFPYAHFWFLQAILLIFVFYSGFDILTRGRLLLVSLAVACAVYLLPLGFPSNVMSVNHALYLLPYFLTGIVMARHEARAARWRPVVILLSAAILALGVGWVLRDPGQNTAMLASRHDLQSLMVGMSGAVLLLGIAPRVTWLNRFGSLAFTIYLYHIFGTSLARRALDAAGIDDLTVHICAGLICGLALPAALYLLAAQHNLLNFGLHGRLPTRPVRHKIAT